MSSILSLSPTDNRCFSAEIASALEDINAAVIVQQLHYWMQKEKVGVVVDGVRWVYNSFPDWVTNQFKWLSSWQFRKSMTRLRNLGIVKVIRYKARQWNQTNYYTLDYDVLYEFLKVRSAESIETVEMRDTTARGEESLSLELRDTNISYKETKNTSKEETAKQPIQDAAPFDKSLLRGENGQENKSNPPQELNLCTEDLNEESTGKQKDVEVDKSAPQVEQKLNKKKWKSHREELDQLGLQMNATVLKVIKKYSSEEVEKAIALLKVRKRDKQIENPVGYFVQALKENWVGEKSSSESQEDVFRYWYSLAKELGHVTGAEIRNEEQWVCMSGSWEKWNSVVERGYSLDYLKRVIDRTKNR